MKRSLKKLPALLLALLLALCLAACGGTDSDDDDTGLTDFTPMNAAELTGGWVDDDGNQLVIDPDTGTYDYRTWFGRVGFGPFEVVDDRPVIEYDGFFSYGKTVRPTAQGSTARASAPAKATCTRPS